MPANDQGVKSQARYQLIPRILNFITHKNRVLLIKGAAHKRLWAGLYNGIGGHVERGESILEAAQRELEEEAGLSSLALKLAGIVTVDTGDNPGVGIFIFHSELQAEVKVPPQISPEGTLDWVLIDQIRELPTVEDLPVLLTKVLEGVESETPFIASYAYDDQGRLSIRFS